MEIIKDNNKVIAIIYRESDWIPGLNFITPDEFFLQVSSWWYPKDKKLQSHFHKDFPRQTTKTHEMTYVKQGSMKVTLYSDDKKILKDFILNKGDLAIYANGGHGYEILCDDTQIIESKNGPFIGVDQDKEKF
ncbi:MAG TPA: hypothetical protein P5301_01235 [Bacteroidales bacterium]|nr:hypothetical protein [Caldisericia bacterium]HRR52071.1 hypothetical protein [Bacteroidales bacterium]